MSEQSDDDRDQVVLQTSKDVAERVARDVTSEIIEKARRLDLDVRGVLAILALIGAFTLAFVQLLVNGGTADIPAWAATTVGAIVGFYFGGRGGNGNK